MRIVVFETAEWEHDACMRLQPEHEVACSHETLDERTVADHANAEIVTTFISSRLGGEVLAHLPNLKLIATRSTGYDHIDLGHCAARGIMVATCPTTATTRSPSTPSPCSWRSAAIWWRRSSVPGEGISPRLGYAVSICAAGPLA